MPKVPQNARRQSNVERRRIDGGEQFAGVQAYCLPAELIDPVFTGLETVLRNVAQSGQHSLRIERRPAARIDPDAAIAGRLVEPAEIALDVGLSPLCGARQRQQQNTSEHNRRA